MKKKKEGVATYDDIVKGIKMREVMALSKKYFWQQKSEEIGKGLGIFIFTLLVLLLITGIGYILLDINPNFACSPVGHHIELCDPSNNTLFDIFMTGFGMILFWIFWPGVFLYLLGYLIGYLIKNWLDSNQEKAFIRAYTEVNDKYANE